jgi:cyclase
MWTMAGGVVRRLGSRSRGGRVAVVALAVAIGMWVGGGRPGALAAAPAPPAPPPQQQDFSKIEIKVVPAAGKVSMLMGSGGNIGVSAGEDGLLMVDDEFEPLAPKIQAALDGLGKGKLKFLVNTHWHGDHTGGNRVFGAQVPILAQSNVRRRMSSEQTVMGQKTPASPKVALPVITFDQSISVHWNGEEIKVIHFPHGHTDGDSVIFFTGSNVVHMGDDFFANDNYPFVDLASGGSVQGLAANVGSVLALLPPDVKVIPGHGTLGTKADLERFHTMLVDTLESVRHRMQAGESLQQMQTEGFPEPYKTTWGHGFVDAKLWIMTIHDSLAAAGKDAAPAPAH